MHECIEGLPLYEGPAAWTAGEMRLREDWIYSFSRDDITELRQATEATIECGVQLIDITRDRFPLPHLGETLQTLQREVVRGRGFVLLRGMPVDDLSIEEAARMYFGLGAWFGGAVPQNAKGHLLGHVKDIGHDPHNPEHRVYATSYRQPFHTDSCDLVALLCLRPAKSGGESAIVSSTSIYNEMVRRRPDLAGVLTRPFVVDRKGEIPEGKGPTYELAVFHHYTGYLTTIYARDFIDAAQRFEDVPRLTAEQSDALNLMDELATSDELRLNMDFRPGDIQILHNHQILHARTTYEDYPEPERRRHLLRLWLSPPNGRPLPPAFVERYGEIAIGTRRGGIHVPGARLSAPLEAE